jgi:hypothetical protein
MTEMRTNLIDMTTVERHPRASTLATVYRDQRRLPVGRP